MAAVTVKSAAALSGMVPDDINAPGHVLCRKGVYLSTAALDANSIAQLVPVKDNMQIVDIKLKWTAFGAGRTLDVGDGSVVDRYFDGLDVSAAGHATLWSEGEADSLDHEYTGDDTIDAKVLGDTWPDACTVTIFVFYTMTGVIADEG